jgi:putative heme-binding domain-containing protein
MGRPDPAERQTIIDHIDFHYPARTDALNRELSRLLVYLEAPTVIERTLGLMNASAGKPSREITELLARNPDRGGKIARMIASGQEPQNTHYVRILSNVRYGWTLNQRKEYFEWIRGALARRGGRSYEGYIENIRKRALENASEAERTALAATSSPPVRREADLPRPHGPGREWSLDEIVKRTASGLKGRRFDKGKRAYDAAQCVLCHRFDGDGGGTGPDLTDLGGRFSLRDIAEAIVAPSKAIPDRYQASVVVTTAGDALTGRVIGETDDHVSLLTDPVDLTQRAKIKKADILQRSLSPTSLMPEGLLNTLNEDEVLDLMAYLISRGNSGDPVFSD